MKNLTTSKKIAIVILLLAMVAATFIGVPLNGGDKGWVYVYTIELQWFKACYGGVEYAQMSLLMHALTVLQIVVHISLFALPFLIGSKRFFSWLVILPLLYVLLQLASFFYLIILLVPFILIWIITMIIWKNVIAV